MKKFLLLSLAFLSFYGLIGQNKNYKSGITIGGTINHYNGNLGNSFLQLKTTCFAGVNANFGIYINKSFDFNISAGAGHFGYCQTNDDIIRLEHLELKCPGCTDKLGMGELRSLMISGNFAIKYKFANGFLMKENSRVAPYVYFGMGVNHLSDNMKKKCVNVGYHLTINTGVGIRYNITEKFNIGYNLGVGSFVGKKVYSVSPVNKHEVQDQHDEIEKMEKRNDLIMQNSLSFGLNF